jgi:hypothetical protein
MKTSSLYLACALALAQMPGLALAQTNAPTSATTVEGIAFDREITLAGSTLKLNGAGIRSKFVFKVYTAGLYLPATAKTSADVYAAKGPKRMKVVFLRDTDASSFGKTMSDVMGDNLPREQFSKCIPGLIKLGEVFANKRKMAVNEGYTLDELPGEGTVVSINGQLVAKVSEPEFFTCLMYNYFGDKPADPKLKTALLGGQ